MKSVALVLFFVLSVATAADAHWQVYRDDPKVVASVDYISYRSFHGRPSVWVRWHYKKAENGVAGTKIQFTADCSTHKLFEIATAPYDVNGSYLAATKSYRRPKEFPLARGSLNEATYDLLCGREWK